MDPLEMFDAMPEGANVTFDFEGIALWVNMRDPNKPRLTAIYSKHIADRAIRELPALHEFLETIVSEATNNDACAFETKIRAAHHRQHEMGVVTIDIAVTDYLT